MTNTTDQSAITCDETRSTRLHYQLRCLLPAGHADQHAWTPELLPVADVRASA
jgi:hypothetical protein